METLQLLTASQPLKAIQKSIDELKVRTEDMMGQMNRLREDVMALERYTAAIIKEPSGPWDKKKTIADQVELMLRSYQRPMTIQELVPLLRKQGALKAKDGTNAVYVTLQREPKRFKKTGRGQYYLGE